MTNRLKDENLYKVLSLTSATKEVEQTDEDVRKLRIAAGIGEGDESEDNETDAVNADNENNEAEDDSCDSENEINDVQVLGL